MANEDTTATSDDLFDATRVGTRIIDEIRPYNVSRPFFRFQGVLPTNVFKFTLNDDPGPASAKAEGVSMNNTAMGTSAQSATAATVGMQATVTDELKAIALIDAVGNDREKLVRSVGEKYETDFTALVDDFSNTTGTSGVDCSGLNLLQARAALLGRDATGPLVGVLHTVQTQDIAQDMITSSAAYWGNTQAMIGGLDATKLAGYAGAPFGIPLFHTTLVPTANAAADRAGGLFIADVALGLYEIWGTRVEFMRELGVGDQIAVTARYGVVEVRDTWGQSIVTDA